MTLIPVTILTGFLGAGKTTLLKRILTEAHGLRIAVIENEFGQENIDAEILVSGTEEHIVQMSNGCVCCSIRDDLRTTLRDLAERRRKGALQFERVVIETTGLADPGPVAQTFFMDERLAEAFTLDAILTLVDGAHGSAQLDRWQEARRQVGFADRLLVSKTDLVPPEAAAALRQRLVRMNPRAPQRRVHFGQLALSEVFDLRGFDLTSTLEIDPSFMDSATAVGHAHPQGAEGCDHEHPGQSAGPGVQLAQSHPHDPGNDAHARVDDVRSFVFAEDRAFDASKLEQYMARLVDAHGPALLRYKGVLHLHGVRRKVILQGVHQLMSSDQGQKWGEGEVRRSRIVFIGIELPEEEIRNGLERCLV